MSWGANKNYRAVCYWPREGEQARRREMVVSDSTGRERDTNGADFLQWLTPCWLLREYGSIRIA